MTTRKASPLEPAPDSQPGFRIVCIKCDALGIVYDCPEGAPSSIQIKCQNCGAPRGTLGDLRRLSYSDRQDLVEI
jgi:ribosomal protein S27E